MKKFGGVIVSAQSTLYVICAAICAALAVSGCGSAPSASDDMEAARRNAPQGVLVGMATAKESSHDESMIKAEAQARLQLVRAINSIVTKMVRNDAAAGKLEPAVAADFKHGVISKITMSKLDSAVKQGQDVSKEGICWAVFYMEKADVIREINQAVAAVKAAYPAAASFSIEDKIDEEFKNAASREWKNKINR